MISLNELTKGDLIIYEDENDKIEIEAFLYDETIWLPLNKIAELFEKDKSTISEHIKNIFDEQELSKDSTVGKFPTVQIEGNRKVNRNIDYYNFRYDYSCTDIKNFCKTHIKNKLQIL